MSGSLEENVRLLVQDILNRYDLDTLVSAGGPAGGPVGGPPPPARGGRGIFATIDDAVAASRRAQAELLKLPLETRRALIAAMREAALRHNETLSRLAVEETGLGNVAHKQAKNALVALRTPGVEDVESTAYSDEHGLTLVERAPFGVIGSITPTTNPTSTIINNGIGMIAAGNSVVFNPHPAAKGVSCRTIDLLNEAIEAAGGPANLLAATPEPTIESAGRLMKHQDVALMVVTGGPAVVRAAMGSGKKVIAAGPGNPPCVVDETADLARAGRDIVAGAGFDYNVVCICEKEVLVVASVADRLKEELRRNGAYELNEAQIRALTEKVIAEPGGPGREGAPNKAFVGKSPQVLARAIGLEVPASTPLLLAEVGREHPLLWTEQLMPLLPLTRLADVDTAIELAVQVEHGFRHTAMMHSLNVEKLSRMARAINSSLFVKNGPCYAGLGQGGAGFTSFTIASPTGEGLTRARTFTRERRCTLVDYFRII